MDRLCVCLLFAAFLAFQGPAAAKGGVGHSSTHSNGSHSSHSGGHSSSHSSSTGSHSATKSYSHGSSSGGHASSGTPSSKAVPGVKRDSHGHIARSETAKNDFKKSHPCPSTGKGSGSCPGYVIDHVTPLKRGGADSPSNMQWQTKEAAKIKDRTE
jgi:hypothetical protein